MRPKKEFNLVASIILILCLVAWFLTQRHFIGPVEYAPLMSVLNILVHGLTLFVVLLIIASLYLKN